MNRIMILFFASLFIAGCSYGREKLESYLENPPSLLEDPHFAEYNVRRDQLESDYLQKKITYAEYLQKRDELDAVYDREVRERNEKISPSSAPIPEGEI